MDVPTEKLHLIEQLAKLQDIKIIQQIKDLLNNQQGVIAGYKPDGKVITQADLIARAEDSNKAIKKGKITPIEDLEKESKGW